MTNARSSEMSDATVRKVSWRLVPLLAILFLVSFIDRTNVGFAALRMQSDLGLSPTAYGLAADIFCIGYFAFEVPSNIALYRVGARRWLARIMLTWGAIALAMALVLTTGALTAIPYAFAAAANAGGAATDPWTLMLGFTLLAAGAYCAINVFWSIPTQVPSGPGVAGASLMRLRSQ